MTLGSFVNGFLIGKVRLSFFVVTLGSLALLRGLVYVWTNGKTTYVDDYPIVHAIGDGLLGGVPVPLIIMVALFAAGLFVLKYTHFGRYVYAVGGNQEAARLAGINVGNVKLAVYSLSALLAGLAGIMQTGRLNAASPVVGQGIELDVAAAVLLGGTSFSGGVGSLWGTVVGVLFIATLQNGLSVAGLQSFWQQVVTGAILILAVLFDRFKNRQPA
jgi:ribose transport system permease protein